MGEARKPLDDDSLQAIVRRVSRYGVPRARVSCGGRAAKDRYLLFERLNEVRKQKQALEEENRRLLGRAGSAERRVEHLLGVISEALNAAHCDCAGAGLIYINPCMEECMTHRGHTVIDILGGAA